LKLMMLQIKCFGPGLRAGTGEYIGTRHHLWRQPVYHPTHQAQTIK
jgi:hypothetical protein